MNTKQFHIDIGNLKKAGIIPVIIAALMGLSFLFDISFGSFLGLIHTILWAATGVLYSHYLFKSGGGSNLKNVAINGGVLAALACLVYAISASISIMILPQAWGIDLGFIMFYPLEAAIIGAIAAVAWYAFLTEKVLENKAL